MSWPDGVVVGVVLLLARGVCNSSSYDILRMCRLGEKKLIVIKIAREGKGIPQRQTDRKKDRHRPEDVSFIDRYKV